MGANAEAKIATVLNSWLENYLISIVRQRYSIQTKAAAKYWILRALKSEMKELWEKTS